MRLASVAAVVLALALIVRLASVDAQTPSPASPSATVAIPASATLEPGGSVTFRRPSDGATLTITSTLPDRLTLRYGGSVLTVDPSFVGECWVPPASPRDRHVSCGRDAVPRSVEPAVGGARLLFTPVTVPPVCPVGGPAPVLGPGQVGPCPQPSAAPLPPITPAPITPPILAQPTPSPRPALSPAPSPPSPPLFARPAWQPPGPMITVESDRAPVSVTLPPSGNAWVRPPAPAPFALGATPTPAPPRNRPPDALQVLSYADVPVELVATTRSVTITVTPDLIIWASVLGAGSCALVEGRPYQVNCSGPPVLAMSVAFTTAPASGERETVLDRSESRLCIPESGQLACFPERQFLWDGRPEAWARRGVSAPDAVFVETVLLRVRAGDPATIGAIARLLGAPYVKITRLHPTGADDWVEVTNLGGGPQEMTGWTLRALDRDRTFRFPSGFTLAPGQSQRIFSARPPSCPVTPPGRPPLVDCDGLQFQLWRGFNAPDTWPDDGGHAVLFYDALGLPGDDTVYSADPANQPPAPYLRLVQFVPPGQR